MKNYSVKNSEVRGFHYHKIPLQMRGRTLIRAFLVSLNQISFLTCCKSTKKYIGKAISVVDQKWTNLREGMLSLNLSRYTNDASISDQNLPQPLTKILFSLAFFKEYMSIQSKIVGQLSKQTPTVQRNPSMFRMFFSLLGWHKL